MFQLLIVDDDRHIRFVLKELLELEGYTIFTAKNGEEALNTIFVFFFDDPAPHDIHPLPVPDVLEVEEANPPRTPVPPAAASMSLPI